MSSGTRPRSLGVVLLAILILGFGTGGKKQVRESRATAHYKLGMRYFQEGELRGAVNELSKAVDLVPKEPSYRVALGTAYLLNENPGLAEEQFLRALKLNPLDTDVHHNLGLVYAEMRDYARAEEEYRRVLADPGYMTPEKVYLNWGIMLRNAGDPQGAEIKIREALEISPRYVRGHYELGETLAMLDQPEEALAEYLKAAEAMSRVPELNLKIGRLYRKLGKPCEARVYFEKVLVADPESDEADSARTHLDLLPACIP